MLFVTHGCITKVEKENDPVTPTDQEISKKLYSVTGYVRAKSTGKGITGANVNISSNSVSTNDEGKYVISGLEPGSKSVWIEHKDYDYISNSLSIVNADISQDYIMTWKYPVIQSITKSFVNEYGGLYNTHKLTAKITDEKGDETISSVTISYDVKDISTYRDSGTMTYDNGSKTWIYIKAHVATGTSMFKNMTVTITDSDGNKTVKTYL